MTPFAGLCPRCAHVRTVGNRRGSVFYMCELGRTDPRFPRYPALPVLRCEGFTPSESPEEPPPGSES